MEREDTQKFTNSVILLSKLLVKIEDKFLARKLYEKIADFILAFVEQKSRSSITSHNINYVNLANSFTNLLDYLEYLAHISKDIIPLLVAQRNLLKFKLYVLKQGGRNRDIKIGEFSKISATSDVPMPAEVLTLKPSSKIKTVRPIPKSNSTKERILNFVRKFPDVRTKEIIDKFNALSGRTVKRNLRELTSEGLLEKKSESGAVYYFQASE